MRLSLALALAFLGACASAPPPPPEPEPAPSPPPPRAETTVEVVGPSAADRELPAHATFGDLVRTARALDERSAPDLEGRCLLGGGEGGGQPFRLAADVAVAVRPLPDAPLDLAPRLTAPAPVRVLSRWGQRGEGEVALVAFTGAPPPEAGGATLVLLTSTGVHLRRTDAPLAPERAGPFALSALPAELAPVLAEAPARLYLSAERGVPLRTLREALRLLGSVPVVLAVVLAEGVPLPAPLQPGRSEIGLCPEGLPAPERGRREGRLSREQLLRPLGELPGAGAACLASAAPESASGGRVVVALRVNETGAVREACAVEDELDDSGVRTCLLDAVRALRFPPPDPPGFVDAALPLRLTPDRSGAPVGLCDGP